MRKLVLTSLCAAALCVVTPALAEDNPTPAPSTGQAPSHVEKGNKKADLKAALEQIQQKAKADRERLHAEAKAERQGVEAEVKAVCEKARADARSGAVTRDAARASCEQARQDGRAKLDGLKQRTGAALKAVDDAARAAREALRPKK
jgi:hypothetical protein